MQTVNKHSHWQNQPLRLNNIELENPAAVLEEFFSYFHLQDMRKILREWLVAALSTDSGEYDTGIARSNLIFAYEKLEQFIEANYVIHRRRKKKTTREGCHFAAFK